MKAFFPISTEYRGIEFRSRLEARWAAFFEVSGMNRASKFGLVIGRTSWR